MTTAIAFGILYLGRFGLAAVDQVVPASLN